MDPERFQRELLDKLGAAAAGAHALTLVRAECALRAEWHRTKSAYSVIVSTEVKHREPPKAAPDPYREQQTPSGPAVEGRPLMVLALESTADVLGKDLGLNREASTGDTAFDDAVYIAGTAPEDAVRAVWAAERARTEALGLLRAAQGTIHINDGTPSLRAEFSCQESELSSKIEQAVNRLHALWEALPHFTGSAAAGGRSRDWLLPVAGLVSAPSAGIALFIANRIWRPVDDVLFVYGVFSGVGAWAAIAGLVWWVARGAPTGLRTFALTVVPALVASVLLGMAGLEYVNGAMDRSPPEQHRVRVLKKTLGGNKSQYCYVRVPDWRPGRTLSVQLEIDRPLWNGLAVDDDVLITAGRGRFGWAWWSDIAMAKRAGD